jgi:hypothetical protein
MTIAITMTATRTIHNSFGVIDPASPGGLAVTALLVRAESYEESDEDEDEEDEENEKEDETGDDDEESGYSE